MKNTFGWDRLKVNERDVKEWTLPKKKCSFGTNNKDSILLYKIILLPRDKRRKLQGTDTVYLINEKLET